MQNEIADKLQFALNFTWSVSKQLVDLYHANLSAEQKSDGSPVTQADRQIEKIFRAQVADKYHDDGVIGEEFPELNHKKQSTWTIDPIDGTLSFVHGVPLFGTMCALLIDEEPVLGVIHFPILGITLKASKGSGAFYQTERDGEWIACQVEQKNSLEQSTLCYSGLEYFKMTNELPLLQSIRDRVYRERTWGDCYGYYLAARGKIDIMLDPWLGLWDLAPIKIIYIEAGGTFHDWVVDEAKQSYGAVACPKSMWQELQPLFKHRT